MVYEIVKYHPAFKSQVVELQTHLWSPDVVVNTAYMKWKYEQNPYLDTLPIYLALCAGRVVGMRGIYGAKWEIGRPAQTLAVLCAGDSVTAPEHRNRGIYKMITETVRNDLHKMGYEYVFSLSTGRVTLPASLAMGWRSAGSSRMMIREARKNTISSSEELTPFSCLDRNITEERLEVSPSISLERTARAEVMAQLVERLGSDGRIRHVRDEQYFSWRFQDPLSHYRFLYWEDLTLDGYLVLQAARYRERSRVNIVDWEGANTQVAAELLRAAIRLGCFDLLTIWSSTLPDESKMLLQDAGFAYCEEREGIKRSPDTILVRSVGHETTEADWIIANRHLLDLNNWDLRMIYSDAY